MTDAEFKSKLSLARNGSADAQFDVGLAYLLGDGTEKSYAESYKWFETAANQGHGESMFYISDFYFNGDYKEKDMALFYQWSKRSAEAGSLNGMRNLAYAYSNALGTEKDLKESFVWRLKIAETVGEPSDKSYLGYMYTQGIGTDVNVDEGIKWYTIAAEGNYLDAMFRLGAIYSTTKMGRYDIDKTVYWLLKASELGHTASQYYIGMYLSEWLPYERQNKEEGFRWLLRSAENGRLSAQVEVAKRYEKGIGTKKNKEEAQKWYEVAADNGDASSALHTAKAYYNGENGAIYDLEKAIAYYKKAAEFGDAEAQLFLATSYRDGNRVEIDDEEAFKWFSKSALQKSLSPDDAIDVNYSLGTYYESGRGCEQSYEKAYSHYRLSRPRSDIRLAYLLRYGLGCDRNYSEAFSIYSDVSYPNKDVCYELGCMYRDGLGTDKNPTSAIFLFEEAAKSLHSGALEALRSEADKGNTQAQYMLYRLYQKKNHPLYNFNEAFTYCTKAAEGGHTEAEYALGMIYRTGVDVEADHKVAFLWLSRAAEKNYPMALYQVGKLYAGGIAVQQNMDIASTYFQNAYLRMKEQNKHYPEIPYTLGTYYRHGFGTMEKNTQLSKSLLFESAEHGYDEAMKDIADAYHLGMYDFPTDYTEALYWYSLLIAKENTDAMWSAANIYMSRTGKRNIDKAINLYTQAAVKGHTFAQFGLSQAYMETGEFKKAFMWNKKAAEQSFEENKQRESMFFALAQKYERGIGTEQSYSDAYLWYKRTSDANQNYCFEHILANLKLGDFYYNGLYVERNVALAFDYYMRSAKDNCSEAQFTIGVFYINGEHVERNYSEAFKWFKLAAESKNPVPEAQFNIGLLYLNGVGTPKDPDEARKWFTEAKKNGYEDAAKYL